MKIGVDDYDTSVEQGESWAGGVAVRKRRGWEGIPVRTRRSWLAPGPEPAAGELFVYPYSRRDEMFGTRRFFLYWHGYKPADRFRTERPEGHYGTRAQVFHADDRTYIREHLSEGGRAFWWPTGEEITPDELAAPPAR